MFQGRVEGKKLLRHYLFHPQVGKLPGVCGFQVADVDDDVALDPHANMSRLLVAINMRATYWKSLTQVSISTD